MVTITDFYRYNMTALLSSKIQLAGVAALISIDRGSQQALYSTARVLLDAGAPVWVEEPCYRLVHHVLKTAGCRAVPFPVDVQGLDVSAWIRPQRER